MVRRYLSGKAEQPEGRSEKKGGGGRVREKELALVPPDYHENVHWWGKTRRQKGRTLRNYYLLAHEMRWYVTAIVT